MKNSKRLLAAAMSVIFTTPAFAQLNLDKVGTIPASDKLENAPTVTPEENVFCVDGQNFILLDASKAETDGFFVMAENLYGTQKIDLTPGVSQNNSIAKFDVADENNIAYWLNNEFLENGNGDYALPEIICENLLVHDWQTEPTNATGFTDAYTQSCKLALLSDYEYKTYVEKIGHTPSINNAVSFYLRTACAEDVNNAACYALAVNFRAPGTTVSPKATVAQYVRPVFYLGCDFFEENKVENIGENVIAAMNEFCDGTALAEIYTEEEFNTYFPMPTASINKILGNAVEGGSLSVDYDYEYCFEQGASEIFWYASDEPSDGFVKIAEGASFTELSDYIGKYITVSVRPVGKKGANRFGETVMLETGIGPVIGNNSLAGLFESLQAAEDMTEILEANNNVFGLDLSLLNEENKAFVFSVIRNATLVGVIDLQNAYETGITFSQLQSCAFEELSGLLEKVLPEEAYASFEALTEAAQRSVFEKRASYQDAEAVIREMILAAVTYGKPEELVALLLQEDDRFQASFTEQGEYRTALVAASLMGREFENFAALDKAASQKLDEIRETIATGEELLGLKVQNRIAQTAPLAGALIKTPEENLFSYDGKSFIVLDSIEKKGKTYLFILTKEYYGTYSIDTTPNRSEADAQAKYDMNDPYNIAYWLNHDFIFNGNGGIKLPPEMVRNMDITHVWHTEPSNVPGYGAEHLDVGPVALMSNTEWTQYITQFGLDTNLTNGGAYMRSARAGAVVYGNKQLMTYFGGTGSTLEHSATMPQYIRPVFYLDTDFFKEYKVSAIGDRLAGILQEELTKEELEAIYTKEELQTYFKSPRVENVKITGYPVTGAELGVTYDYISAYPEKDSSIEWMASDTPIGGYAPVGTGKTLKVTNAMVGKFIQARVKPISSAAINPEGEIAFNTEPFGAIVNEAEMLGRINGASESEIFEIMQSYSSILDLDFELLELSDKAPVQKMLATTELQSVEDIYKAYAQAVAIEKINEAEAEAIVELLTDEALLIDQERYEKLAEKKELAKMLEDETFEKLSVFVDTFYQDMAEVEFRKMDRTKVKDFLAYYDFIFDADIEALNETVLGNAGIKLIKKKASDFEALNKAVTAAVKEAKESNSDSGKNQVSSGGGGGSSSGTQIGFSYVTQSDAQQAAQNQEQQNQQTAGGFTDLADAAWAAEKIEALAAKGIVSGMGERIFAPQELVTREQFVQMLVTAFGLTASADYTNSFADVDESAWYAPAIAAAYENGIVAGMENAGFGVGTPITRQDMTVIAARVLGIGEADGVLEFADAQGIAEYAKNRIAALAELGIVNGYEDNTFRPLANTTRAQAAVVIYGLLEQKEGNQ